MAPSGSLDPALLSCTSNGAFPVAGVAVTFAVGVWFGGGLTVMSRVTVPVAPLLSVTVSRAV